MNYEELKSLPLPELLQRLVYPLHVYTFVDQNTGNEETVEAYDVEGANLRAWAKNPALKWKGWITREDNGE